MKGILATSILLAAVLVSTGAAADDSTLVTAVADQRQALNLTLYNQGFGLVGDLRELDLPAGRFRLQWDGVPRQLDPGTVALTAADGTEGPAVLEQVFDEDLVSPARLLELNLGREVVLVQEDRDLREKRTRARLLSTSGPTYEIEGRVVIGHPGRVELPGGLPEGLLLRPALGWLVESAAAGPRRLEARYLTNGLGWSAGYRLELNHDETVADLDGWVSVENNSGADFTNAVLRLVAGDVNREKASGHYKSRNMPMSPAMEMDRAAAAPAGFGEQSFSSYHLYTLERSADILDNRTTRLALTEAAGLPVQRELVLRGNPGYSRHRHGEAQREKVAVMLRLQNSEKDGLGRPLPAGVWQVFKADDTGTRLFLGEDRFGHSARGGEVVIGIGSSFDVTAERLQTDHRELRNVRWDVETAWRITLRNGSRRDEVVKVRESVQGEWELRGASHPHRKVDASTLGFEVAVPAGGEVVLEYRVAIDW